MKGYTSHKGLDCAPCFFCKYRSKECVEAPCYNCIATIDLALHKPNAETNFSCFTPLTDSHLQVLKYEQEAQDGQQG